jgi:hypothetical protein
MATQKQKTTKKPQPQSNTLKINQTKDKSEARIMAEVAMQPLASHVITANLFTEGTVGNVDLTESFQVMEDEIKKVQNGDLSALEATLTAQVITLDKIFIEMARRAAINMGQYRDTVAVYMKLALKAQSQCRTTIQALAEIKNPQPVNIVKQANIANGPQQINNGAAQPDSRVEKNQNQPNELLEVQHGSETLDSRATSETIRKDSAMATLE